MEKAREFQKKIKKKKPTSVSLTMLKPLTCGSQKMWKIIKERWEYQTTIPVSWETFMRVKKQQSEPDMEQWASSILWKEYDKAIYCHPAYLTVMQNTPCGMLSWMNHKLESNRWEKY